MRCLLVGLMIAAAPAALAQETYQPPRTIEGHPDFSGTWGAGFMTFLERPDSRLTERFTRVSPTELLYQFSVEDSDLYTAPWLAEYSFTLQNTTFYEYACHEANYSLTNILLGGRVADAREAAKSKAKKK